MRACIAALACIACTAGGAEPLPVERLAPDALTLEHAAPADLTGTTTQTVANITYAGIPANLIINGDFENYADPHVPTGWSVDEIYGYSGMFAPVDGWRGNAVQFVRNCQGRHLLAQDVPITPNRRYTVQMVYQVVATDSRRGGLYVVDPSSGAVIGAADINRPTNGWRIASVTFDSGSRTHVLVKIGYLSGMNGTAIYDAVGMFVDDPALHYQYPTTYRDAIGIAAQPADALVPQLADYVTTLLAAPQADRLAHQTAYAAVLPYYLNQYLSVPDGSRAAWCQRTSLVLGELLAMYGVPTRQVHIPSPQHQFLEYYNGTKWAVFDAYYGIRYVRSDVRLGVSEILSAGIRQISIDVPTRQRVFLLELGFLLPIWDTGVYTYGLDMP